MGEFVTVRTADHMKPDRINYPEADMRAVMAVLSRARDAADGRELLEMLGLTAPSEGAAQDRYDPARLAHATRAVRPSAAPSGASTAVPDGGETP